MISVANSIKTNPPKSNRNKILWGFGWLFANAFSKNVEEGASLDFERIVCEYDGLIKRICFGFARTAEEMKDFHQDVLINIWQSLNRFRGESSLKTWIYRIALNTCVSTVRKMHVEKTDTLPDLIDDDEEKKIKIMELHDMISKLSELDKAIMLLWLEDFSYEEISSITGLSRNTVATRLRRGKEKLKNIK